MPRPHGDRWRALERERPNLSAVIYGGALALAGASGALLASPLDGSPLHGDRAVTTGGGLLLIGSILQRWRYHRRTVARTTDDS